MLAIAFLVVVAALTFGWPAASRRERIATGLCGTGAALPLAIIADVAIRDAHGGAAMWPMWLALIVSPLSPALGHLYRGRYVTRGVWIRLATIGVAALLVLATRGATRGAGQGGGLGTALGMVVVAMLVAVLGYVVGAVLDLITVRER
jgi:hypothetical protein